MGLRFLEALWDVMLSLAPWLLLGAAVAGVLHVLIPDRKLSAALSGRAGVFKAVLFGVPLPLCSCGVIPAGISLKKRGASDGASLGFLISTPQTGVDSILVSASFLGWPFALFKLGAAALLGVVGGGLAAMGDDGSERPIETGEDPRRNWRDGLEHGIDIVRSIWGWLVFGVVASAALTTFIPTETMSELAAAAGPWALVAVLLISVPLYVCATASVPIAAALVAGGFPAGAALVFLMAGPATNVATIGAVHRAFGRRVLAIYLGTIILGSLALGWAFESVIQLSASGMAHEHGGGHPLEIAGASVLTVMLVGFALSDLRAKLRGEHLGEVDLELPVQGMTCNGCVRKLERVLDQSSAIHGYEVQLDPGRVKVHGHLDRAGLEALVAQAGYQVPPE